jgi:acylphosphatase
LNEPSEHFRILGDVGAARFAGWITAHARKLGLTSRIMSHDGACIELVLSGPPDLLDAMAVGCSLGPREVLVSHIERVRQ